MSCRILFVVDSLFALGPIFTLPCLLRALTEQSFDVALATRCRQVKIPKWLTDLSVPVHRIAVPNRSLNEAIELSRLIRRIDPSIVHAWGEGSHDLVRLGTFFQQKHRRIFSFFERPRVRTTAASLNAAMLVRPDDQFVFSHGSMIENLPRNIRQSQLPAGTDQTVIHHAVEWSHIDRARSRARLLARPEVAAPSDSVLVGAAAGAAPRYRLKDLVWAVDLLCCIRDDVHLLIFGPGPDERLLRFIGQTAAQKYIHFVDANMTNAEDLLALDVFWNGQIEEPQPAPMLGAMKGGIPVVSVLTASTAELVQPLRTGLATNLGARDEFARWTKYLIEQPGCAIQLARQGQGFANAAFPANSAVAAQIRFYESAL